MNNIEQFSIYTAKIFEVLYSEFPVPVGIDRHMMIEEFLNFDKHEELKELQNKKSGAELMVMIERSTPELDEVIDQVSEKAYELEDEERADRTTQINIFDGTIDFLESEGLLIYQQSAGYRLTAKAFSHLNKTFEEGGIKEDDKSYIATIKSIFTNTTSMSKEVAVGTAITIIPQLLGYS